MLMPTNGKGPRKQKSGHKKEPHIGLLVNQPQTAWDSFGQYTGGDICPGGVVYKEIDKCSTVVQLLLIWWKGSIIIQLYPDNASPHSGCWSWKDLLRGICSQHFHCQQVHLWKANECVFSCHQILAQIGGFHGKIQKAAGTRSMRLATFLTTIFYQILLRWEPFVRHLSSKLETLYQRIFRIGVKWSKEREIVCALHLVNPPWCAISFKLRTVRWSSCSWFKLSTWLMLCLTQRDWQTSDWC